VDPAFAPPLTATEFEAVRELVYRTARINLQPGKEGLVRSRLGKHLRASGAANYTEYLSIVELDQTGHELSLLIDSISTNKTSFFREHEHFGLLRKLLAERGHDDMRIWSAGCSTGEEPNTMAMVAYETLPRAADTVRILATDISTNVLRHATQGVYEKPALADIPRDLLKKYFTPADDGRMRVSPALSRLIRYARLNLMATWPMKRPFQVIFCRNVMIYFDRETKANLVARFYNALQPGGHLFVGHSESLHHTSGQFKYVQPAVYRREP
jgi:chemotaxis protein methyltransferase CheR